MKPKFFIGIDISKATLDVAVLSQDAHIYQAEIENSKAAIIGLIGKLKSDFKCTRGNTVFCAESMGVYASFLLKACSAKKLQLCMESPLQIKRSLGIQRGKNDALDALRIAHYASKSYPLLRMWQPPRLPLLQLRTLAALRKRLLKARMLMCHSLADGSNFWSKADSLKIKEYSSSTVKSINEDIQRVDRLIAGEIENDEKIKWLMGLITSVPRIGNVIALQIIIYTNEFRKISTAKKFASYCGIAPFEWTSGTSVKGKSKVSHYANKEIKALLHIAAMGALRGKSSFLATYYQRKVAEGKNKMGVLNAIRNKLVQRVFACVRDNRPFVEHTIS